MTFESGATDFIIKLWTAIVATIGLGIVLYNLISPKLKERKERQQNEKDLLEFAAIKQLADETGTNLIDPKIGSEEYEWAERLVKRNLLERGPYGHGFIFAQTFRGLKS